MTDSKLSLPTSYCRCVNCLTSLAKLVTVKCHAEVKGMLPVEIARASKSETPKGGSILLRQRLLWPFSSVFLFLSSCCWDQRTLFSRWRPTRIVAWLISTRCPDEVRHGEPASCEITTIVCAFLLMSRLQEWFSWVCVHVMYRRAVASVQLASSMPCRMGTLKNVYTLWGAILSPNKNHHLSCLHFLSWKFHACYFSIKNAMSCR